MSHPPLSAFAYDPIDYVISWFKWRQHPGLIYYSWRCRESYSWVWGSWVNYLPWRLHIGLWNYLFHRNVDWRKHGTWWRGKRC